MRAWVTDGRGADRMQLVERPVPSPAPGEMLVSVSVCGVCRTDLHVVDGDLAQHRSPVVPGHEVEEPTPPPPGLWDRVERFQSGIAVLAGMVIVAIAIVIAGRRRR